FTLRRSPYPTLFPYTTLFRSPEVRLEQVDDAVVEQRRRHVRRVVIERPDLRAARGDIPLRVRHADRAQAVAAESAGGDDDAVLRSEEHTSELQSLTNLVCRLL